VRIGILGTLAVHDDAGRPVRVGGSMVRILLIVLALDAGRVVPAYSLIEQLWDDDPPGNAANALQSLVSRLRSALRQSGLTGTVIESHPAGYRLAVSPQDVDAVVFESLARQGNQALASGDAVTASWALREALSAWRGPALADASGIRFAVGPAARLEELRTKAALDLVEAGLALGEGESLIAELRALIAADPVAERPRGLLMRALYAAGRQAEALAVYTETRDLLASELGMDPSAQLEQIYLGVLRQDLPDASRAQPPPIGPAAAAPMVVADLPALRLTGVRKPLTSFVGRDDDLARVLKMLAEGRLVTLTGPGGAGKTRLATEIAARLAEDPLAGTGAAAGPAGGAGPVWFVELTPVTDPEEVPYAVLNAFGIRESPVIAHAGASQMAPADPVQRLVTAVADRRDLLILDNCEHVVAAAAALADQILAACPGLRVLATSREPLRITGEVLWPVPPLPVPPAEGDDVPGGTASEAMSDAGGDVAGYASVRLLADRATAVRPDFRVDGANAADVARVCRALDGMPLAIELAAARLRTLSAAQLAERLGARFELLTGGSRMAAPRHQTLRAVVDWTWELLSETEQVLARRLAIFPGGATLTAAEQVCQDAALPAEAILPTVFGLVEKSFLTVDDSSEPRYRMLETIRVYCTERLAEAGEEDQVRLEFATHFVRLAETADPLLRTAGQDTWMRQLVLEQDNIHAALRWAVDRRAAALALRFGQALGWFWLMRGQRQESGTMAKDILAISEPAAGAEPDPETVQARAVCALTVVNAWWDITPVRQPLAGVMRLMAVEPGAGGGPGGARPHPLVVAGAVMVARYDQRDPDRALDLLAAQFDSPDPWTRSAARAMYAFSSVSLGRLDNVAQEVATALAEFQAIGDRWGTAMALVGQAELATLDGDHARAIAALERAVALGRELTDWQDTAQMYASLAKSRSRLGDFGGALADMAKAERAARQQGESESDLWILYIKAELAWLRDDLAEARSISQRLDARMASMDAAMIWPFQAQARNRGALADIRLGGDQAASWAALANALRLARDSLDRSALAVVIDGLAAAAMWADGSRASAERAAVMLGAAHKIRGTFDHSSLDAPGAREAARRVLGEVAFDAAYQRGRVLSYDEALSFAEDSARSPVSR
jgi:predicted ATPase/DNA-binding SARP family transcriptional activator